MANNDPRLYLADVPIDRLDKMNGVNKSEGNQKANASLTDKQISNLRFKNQKDEVFFWNQANKWYNRNLRFWGDPKKNLIKSPSYMLSIVLLALDVILLALEFSYINYVISGNQTMEILVFLYLIPVCLIILTFIQRTKYNLDVLIKNFSKDETFSK